MSFDLNCLNSERLIRKTLKVKVDRKDFQQGLIAVVKGIFPEYHQVPDNVFIFKKQTDGLSNILFRVSVYDHQFLIRIYGRRTGHVLDRDREINKQIQMHKQGLAAEFYGKFLNGCCYEYLDGKTLTPETMQNYKEQISREMARWHSAVVVRKI